MAVAEAIERKPRGTQQEMQMPPELRGIPTHEKRMALIHEDAFQTALHEGHHVLCIVGENLTLGGVNMNRRGNTLASTNVYGASWEQMRVVAAGGGIETADGRGPSGYGSDMAKVEHLPGTNSHSHVFEAARAHIKRVDKDVRLHFGSLMAWHGGYMTGETVLRFLHIAEMEVTGATQKFESVQETAQPIAVIETYDTGDVVVKIGEEKKTFCRKCFGLGGHDPDCGVRVLFNRRDLGKLIAAQKGY